MRNQLEINWYRLVPRSCYLGFLKVTNSLLLELVSTVSSVWTPGMVSISNASITTSFIIKFIVEGGDWEENWKLFRGFSLGFWVLRL